MKKALIIANEYYPNPSAITNVFSNIIKTMLERDFSVDVLTKRQNVDALEEEVINNVKVYRVEDWLMNSFNITDRIKNYNGIGLFNFVNKIVYVMYKVSRAIDLRIDKYIFKNQDGYINKKQAIKKGIMLNKKENYDVIISLSYPFVMHEIAYKIISNSKHKPKWYAYQFDPNAFNSTLKKRYIKIRLNKEISILKNTEKIFLPKENYEENIQTRLVSLKSKYEVFPYANIKRPMYECKVGKEEVVKFVYTGTFYKEIREPIAMLTFFENIRNSGKLNFKLEIYYKAVEEMKNIIDQYKKRLEGNIYIVENAPKQVCEKANAEANIIINVGNSVANQTPSKIFDDISTGKPIINFYKIDNDTSKTQLEKYDVCMNINEKDVNDKVILDEFIEFVNSNKYVQMSFEEATKNYETCEQVGNKFVDYIVGEKDAKN